MGPKPKSCMTETGMWRGTPASTSVANDDDDDVRTEETDHDTRADTEEEVVMSGLLFLVLLGISPIRKRGRRKFKTVSVSILEFDIRHTLTP